jgi:hypothetical protein
VIRPCASRNGAIWKSIRIRLAPAIRTTASKREETPAAALSQASRARACIAGS